MFWQKWVNQQLLAMPFQQYHCCKLQKKIIIQLLLQHKEETNIFTEVINIKSTWCKQQFETGNNEKKSLKTTAQRTNYWHGRFLNKF